MAKISNSQLIPNKSVIVTGEITFSRVTKKIDGEELKRRDENARFPHTRPYTTLTLGNVQLQPENPNELSINEQYIIGKMFTSKTHPERKWCLTLENKGNSLPTICQGGVNPDGTPNATQIKPTGELANGLHVTVVIRVFKGNPNCGISLDTIIVNEPIKYYDGANASVLESRGITFVPDEAAKKAAQSGEYWSMDTQTQKEVPVQEAISAPSGNPFQSQPVQQAQPEAPAAPVAGVPAGNPFNVQAQPVAQAPVADSPVAGSPVAGTPVANSPVASSPVASSPVASSPVADSPVANSPVAEASPVAGIVYNAGSRNY